MATALAELSAPRTPILPQPSGHPGVPVGFAGSISHKGPAALALAVRTADGVGIDIEFAEPKNAALAPKVLTTDERTRLGDYQGLAAAHYVVAHFALKEAIYKALTSSEQVVTDFESIELQVPMVNEVAWVDVPVQVATVQRPVSARLLVDGNWAIATALVEARLI